MSHLLGKMTGRKKSANPTALATVNVTQSGGVMIDDDNLLKIMKKLQDEGTLGGFLTKLGISYDESDKKDDEQATRCGHCHTEINDDGVQCAVCQIWYHVEENECSGIDSKFTDLLESEHIWYVCEVCKDFDMSKHRNIANNRIIEESLEEIKTKSETLTMMMQDSAEITRGVADNMGIINNKIDNVDRDIKTVTNEKTYAETLKTKQALVIKSTPDSAKAVDRKKTIMSKITAPVEDVKETKDGHLLVRFEDKTNLERAKTEIEKQDDLSVNEKGKQNPKIKIVYVHRDEDDVLNNIVIKKSMDK